MTERNPADVQDIVNELRAAANGMRSIKSDKGDYGLCDDAADEIERLRAAQSDLVKQINGLNDTMAQAEGMIADLRADRYL